MGDRREPPRACKANGIGEAYADGIGFAVPEMTSERESFSPDASYYVGPHPANEGDFISGAPTFAVEVRSKGDYGPAAEREMADKRADYFEAATLTVWDDNSKSGVVRSYRAEAPDRPCSDGARRPTPNRPALAGGLASIASSPESPDRLTTPG